MAAIVVGMSLIAAAMTIIVEGIHGIKTHTRRKLVETERNRAGDRPRAVALLGRLFAVEEQAKDVSVAERLALRQTQSVPMLAELRRKLLTWKEQLLTKHPLAEAVNYTLSQWEELSVFTTDGAVPIDDRDRRSGIAVISCRSEATLVFAFCRK